MISLGLDTNNLKISVAVMAHPKRRAYAFSLAAILSEMPFTKVEVIFDKSNNEWATGVRAINERDLEADWHIVIQDDARITENFYNNVHKALSILKRKTCVSFYFGKTSPFPQQSEKAYKKAREIGASWIQTQTLFWGVCIALPCEHIPNLVTFCAGLDRPYDNRIGKYFYENKMPVLNLMPSIADHFPLESLIPKHGEKGQRCAYWFAPELIEVNSKSIIF